jgi:hypothetical protein
MSEESGQNAKNELLDHIEDRKVVFVSIQAGRWYAPDEQKVFAGELNEVLPMLDFSYDNGFGSQYLHGTIWYEDGTWSERGEYDGSEWWEHRQRPEIPNKDKK